MKSVILWSYSRGTWQYDVFCLLIIGFIFLTPKAWFDRGEKMATRSAHNVVKAQDFSPGNDLAKNQNIIAQFNTPVIQRQNLPQ